MYRYSILVISAFSFLTSCSQTQYGFSGDSTIDAQQDNFFVLKYVAWKECKIGGTLNQIAIRNSSPDDLIVEDLKLTMAKDGKIVTASEAPKIYTEVVISDSAIQVNEWSISSGEWRYFAFPVEDCAVLSRNDIMEYNFRVRLKAGNQIYENASTFQKSVTASPIAWL